ncbi:MAG TPA: YHS domain-containing protein [Sedimentisphaerales bacterium]|nr:YHS domain-containing protein [Sedimentisphaerales bacterium]
MKTITILTLAAAGLAVSLGTLAGCKKQEPAAPASPNSVTAAAEQTICPVMAGLIDKNVFVEYKGQRVYFCCPGCKDEFEKDPEKYIEKLPQFRR